MRRLLPGCVVAGIYLLGSIGYAVEVKDLFETQVAVEDQSSAKRAEAFQAALGNVLIKISGSRDIQAAPGIEAVTKNAARYARRYHYLEKPTEAAGEPAGAKTPDEAKQLYIAVEFDGEALQRVLREAGLPVWSANRPQVLVWLGVDRGPRDRFIVSEDSGEDIGESLMEAARRRGLPLILPLMDLEDRRRVTFVDISAGFADTLSRASERYNAQTVLVGHASRGRGDDWSVEWTVLRDNVSTGWRESGVDLQQAIDSGVDGLADILASRYAHSSSGGELVQYIVAVEEVASLDDYAAVLIYLENLVFVEDVTPVSLESGQVYYRVTMRGALRELERSLGLMPSLRPVAVVPENPPPLTAQPFGSPVTEATDVQPSVRERVDLRYHFVVR